ncbi:MAG: ribosome biogenesis GTPase YlqF [Candidatus Obscuribacterales bacterium]|nr:ribosome biogenesis GTPase YlqF [Candidatus Obscuribacterales bacterium]
MGKTTPLRRLQEQLQAVDILFEVLDARLPFSSRHPKSLELFGPKTKLTILSKSDLADEQELNRLLAELAANSSAKAIPLCLKTQKGQNKLISLALELTAEKRAALARRGLLPRPIRACVVGLPNVGKSSLINWLIGRKKAAVGDRPGITRGNSWVRIHPQLELLDTPGMLPPVSFDEETALKLALCRILPDDHYEVDLVAEKGLALMAEKYPRSLDIYRSEPGDSEVKLVQIAEARSCLLPGGRLDLHRAASIFINDFRNGKLGKVMFDEIKR